MTEYEQYVDAVNKIYSYLEMMKTVWTDQDNISYLDNLETYKQVVINKREFDSYVDHKMIEYTSIALKDMRIRGANKQLIFDIFVLNIRTLR